MIEVTNGSNGTCTYGEVYSQNFTGSLVDRTPMSLVSGQGPSKDPACLLSLVDILNIMAGNE